MDQDAEYRRELRTYQIGYAVAIALTTVPFALVALGALATATVLIVIAAFALVQIVIHFRFFLHIDLSQSKRDDLQLILFTTLIICVMVGGTLWILFNLRMRMM